MRATLAYTTARILLFVVSVIWVVYGLARPFLDLLSLYETEIAEAVLTEVRTCQRDSAATLPPNTVEQVVSGMTAELAPRPLQKLLIEAGHLDR